MSDWAIAFYKNEEPDSGEEPSVVVQSAGNVDVESFATAAISILVIEHAVTKEQLLEYFDAVTDGDVIHGLH